MKNLKIIVCLIFFVQFGYSQNSKELNIYYDAVDLKNGKRVIEILSKYKVDTTNLYLKDVKIPIDILSTGENSVTKSNTAGNLLNKLGNIEITPIADGLAQFIASRVKKELSIAFFERFKREIKSEDYKDFQILFPESYKLLQLIDTDIYDFQPYLSDLQQNARSDFKMMPSVLPNLLADSTTKLSIATKSKPRSKYILGQSFGLISSFHERNNIGAALEKLNTSLYKSAEQNIPDLKKSIDLVRLFSIALRDSTLSDSTYYLRSETIAKIIKDSTLLKNIIGLAIATSKLDSTKFDKTIYDLLNKQEYSHKITIFSDIFSGFKDANKYFEEARKEKAEEKINTYLQGVNQIFVTGKLITNTLKINTPTTDSVFSYLDKSIDLVGTLYQKKYSTAILQTLDFYKTLADGSQSPINTKIYKYGTFLAQISELEKSEDVVKVLEYYAAPIGSYRDKSISKFTVSLDSFTGVRLGSFNADSTRFALSTPIGVSFSFSKGLGKWSWTIMPTLFDIGPLVSYRFFTSKGEVASIYLKEIFAPGIFVSVGFNSKIPIFLNVGYQKPAYIKTVGTTDKTFNLEPYKLFSANIAINIPLFKLYTK